MIIQVRGTSGSGKSTVVRRVMDAFESGWAAHRVKGRKRPLYYFNMGDVPLRIAVLGHYDSPCGGCDTIGSARAVYELIQTLPNFDIILCEGLLLSEDTKWSSQLVDLRVVFLTTSLERCLKQIEGRRREAGNDKPLNTTNTSRRVDVIDRARVKLTESGATCRRTSADQAVNVIVKWIGEANV